MRMETVLCGLAAALAACTDDVPVTDPMQGGGAGGTGAGGGMAGDPGELGDPLIARGELQASQIIHYLQSAPHGDALFACTGLRGLASLDVGDPVAPSGLDQVSFGASRRCQYVTIDAERSLAFVTHAEEELDPVSFIGVVDIADPAAMATLAVVPRAEQPAGIDVADGLIAVAAKSAGLLLFSWDGQSLSEVGQLALEEAWSVRLAAGHAFVMNGAAGLAVIDVSDPATPALVASLALDAIARDLVLDGDRLYAALGSDGVATIDVADPAAPALLDVDDTPGSAIDIALDGATLLVADWNDIRVFRLDDRDDPFALGHEALPLDSGGESRCMGVSASGGFLYASNWDIFNSYEIVTGVSAPDLTATPRSVLLPTVGAGETVSASLVLSNDGPRDLAISGVTSESGLEILLAPETIAAFDSAIVEIRYTAPDAEPFSGTVIITSDDIDEPSQSIAVSANTPGIGVGDSVPADWTWLDLDGNQVALAAYQGEVTLLAYFATF